MAALCLAVALLAGAASSAGVFRRGSGETRLATSARGESYRYAVDGIYAWNAQRVVSEGVGWDFFTLFVAVPSLLAASVFVARGSYRGRLFAVGMLGYFFYQYFEYATYWAYGPLFLLFITIYATSLAGIVWMVSSLDVRGMAARFSDRFPRKAMAALCFVMSFALVFVMWLPLVLRSMTGKVDGILLGQTTLVVQAFDLGLIVPLAVFTGVAILRRRPIGYLLSAVFVVKAAAMACAIAAMLLSAWAVEGRLETLPFIFFVGVALTAFWIFIRVFSSVDIPGSTEPGVRAFRDTVELQTGWDTYRGLNSWDDARWVLDSDLAYRFYARDKFPLG